MVGAEGTSSPRELPGTGSRTPGVSPWEWGSLPAVQEDPSVTQGNARERRDHVQPAALARGRCTAFMFKCAWGGGVLRVSRAGAPGCPGGMGSCTTRKRVPAPWLWAPFRPQGRATLGAGPCSAVPAPGQHRVVPPLGARGMHRGPGEPREMSPWGGPGGPTRRTLEKRGCPGVRSWGVTRARSRAGRRGRGCGRVGGAEVGVGRLLRPVLWALHPEHSTARLVYVSCDNRRKTIIFSIDMPRICQVNSYVSRDFGCY